MRNMTAFIFLLGPYIQKDISILLLHKFSCLIHSYAPIACTRIDAGGNEKEKKNKGHYSFHITFLGGGQP